ncbi:MAG: hypothetical protein DHS20C21_11970 [Gemmatimonadota bacterium]|nr:MAG: hypothetical protein DHS20C21_11970 [Gemmatimonadota bacterium]
MLHRVLLATFAGFLCTGSATAATHQVMQVGLTFDPADITIEVGDTVEWIWSAGGHTVTEGTDDANPPLGDKLFDAPLALADPLFSYTFTEAGDVDYYCRPHLIFNMVGVIRVQQPTSTAEPPSIESWGRVKAGYR